MASRKPLAFFVAVSLFVSIFIIVVSAWRDAANPDVGAIHSLGPAPNTPPEVSRADSSVITNMRVVQDGARLTSQVVWRNGAPANGVTLTCNMTSTDAKPLLEAATTDSKGIASWNPPFVRDGCWLCAFSGTNGITVVQGARLVWWPNKQLTDPVVVDRLPGIVHGLIVDRDTRLPIAAARLHCLQTDEATTSDSDGRFALGRWPSECMTIAVVAAGYVACRQEMATGTQLLVIEIGQGLDLLGWVVDARGQGVPGAVVAALGVAVAPALTGSDGKFALCVPAGGGRISLRVSKLGCAEVRTSAFAYIGMGPLKLVLPKSPGICGFVRDEEGRPVFGAAVTYGGRNGGRAPWECEQLAITQKDGAFQLPLMNDGGTLYAEHPDFGVGAGSTDGRPGSAPLVIVLRKYESIDVWVTTENGTPVTRGRVEIAADSMGSAAPVGNSGSLDQRGCARVSVLRATVVRVALISRSHQAEPVEIPWPWNGRVNLVVQPRVALSGRVVGGNGVPVTAFSVRLLARRGEGPRGMPGDLREKGVLFNAEDGRFWLRDPTIAAGYRYDFIIHALDGQRLVVTNTEPASAGGPTKEYCLQLAELPSWHRVRVTSSEQTGVRGASVVVRESTGRVHDSQESRAVTGEDGTALVRLDAGETAELVVTHPAFVPWRGVVSKSEETTVCLTNGASLTVRLAEVRDIGPEAPIVLQVESTDGTTVAEMMPLAGVAHCEKLQVGSYSLVMGERYGYRMSEICRVPVTIGIAGTTMDLAAELTRCRRRVVLAIRGGTNDRGCYRLDFDATSYHMRTWSYSRQVVVWLPEEKCSVNVVYFITQDGAGTAAGNGEIVVTDGEDGAHVVVDMQNSEGRR